MYEVPWEVAAKGVANAYVAEAEGTKGFVVGAPAATRLMKGLVEAMVGKWCVVGSRVACCGLVSVE